MKDEGTDKTTDNTQNQVPKAAETASFHNLTGNESGKNTNQNRTKKSPHNVSKKLSVNS